MLEHKVLAPADAPALFAFLEERLETSLFLVANAEEAGLEDHGEPLQGTYVGAFEGGTLTAVAAHYGNGMVAVQGDAHLEAAVLASVARTGRPVTILIGPLAQVERARRALGMQGRAVKRDEPEILYALRLERLRVPPLLGAPGVECRPPTTEEMHGVVVDWRVALAIETLGSEPSPTLRDEVRAQVARWRARGWVLVDGRRPVSFTQFTARTRGVVQVGGVFTPPELRGRGYARAVVAGSLLDARAQGATRSVLFTARTNRAAQRAYVSLGYEEIGSFGLVLFA
jgi:ribosomal protein S18 acetylase RimI-like enzyme